MMDIREILDLLPHRYPFILIDKVLEVELGKRIVAIKNVTMNEPFFQGHFPGMPVMPGVLILEAMAQAAAILAFKSRRSEEKVARFENELCYFAGVDNARFKKPVLPGDQLLIEAIFLKTRQSVFAVKASASVNGAVVCEGELMAMIKTFDNKASS